MSKPNKHTMNAAIAELKSALYVLETNEPIHRQSGEIDQANLDSDNASDIRRAITLLQETL